MIHVSSVLSSPSKAQNILCPPAAPSCSNWQTLKTIYNMYISLYRQLTLYITFDKTVI